MLKLRPGTGRAEVIQVDLNEGWKLAQLADDNRRAKNRNKRKHTPGWTVIAVATSDGTVELEE